MPTYRTHELGPRSFQLRVNQFVLSFVLGSADNQRYYNLSWCPAGFIDGGTPCVNAVMLPPQTYDHLLECPACPPVSDEDILAVN